MITDPSHKRFYTLERLEELYHEADIAGDVATRDKLAKTIFELGGKDLVGKIPEDETEIERLVRLRRKEGAASQSVVYKALAMLVADYEKESDGSRLLRQLSEATKEGDTGRIQVLMQQLTEREIATHERFLREAVAEEDDLGIEVFTEELARLKRDGYQWSGWDCSHEAEIDLKEALYKKLPPKQIRELLEAYIHRHDSPEDCEQLTRLSQPALVAEGV